jgi:hypothetical protein
MNITSNKNFSLVLPIVCIIGLISCGGGGGGGGDFVPSQPTGLTYTGVNTPAVIDSNNVAELASDAFIGGETGSNLGLFTSVNEQQTKINREIQLFEIVQILGSPLYKIDFNSHRGDSLAVQTEQETVNGECGGTASYTVTMDDVNGTFTGSMTFTSYCNEDTTISGTAGFSGLFNVNTSDFLNFALSLNMVSLTSGNQSYVIDGDVSVDVSGSQSIASLDMFMKDSSGEVFWVKDYTLRITEGLDYVDLEVSGRFYHPTYGYVDLSTITPVRTYNSYEWPSSGVLQIVGGGGTTAQLLAINENYCQIIADTNGDGYDDYDSGQMSWNDL